MLRTRVLTAVILLAVLAGTAAFSPEALQALAAALLSVALYEWLRLAGLPAWGAMALALAVAAAALWLQASGIEAPTAALALACAAACGCWITLGALLVFVQRHELEPARALPRSALVMGALALCTIAWFALVHLLRTGLAWTVSVLALVWVADIAAYFTGRAWGRRKLADRISPGKTWAGVWGAAACVVVLAEALRWAWPQAAFWSTRMLVAAPLGGVVVLLALVAISIVGDLFESLVKRRAGAKDSGWILPGHGGVWDRIDATLPVLPLAVLGEWVLGFGAHDV